MATGPEFFGRTVPTDDEAAAYCETLEGTLRQDIASILWWDNVDRQPMPKCFELSNMGLRPCNREYSSRADVVKALKGAGYTAKRAESRVSSVDYNDNKKRRIRESFCQIKAEK